MSARTTVQVLTPALAAGALSGALLVPDTSVRAAIVLPIALLLPGYALLLLAFGPGRRFDWVPGLALSALLSMAFLPLAGLALAAATVPPSTRSAAGAIDAVVVVALVASLARAWRRRGAHPDEAWLPAAPPADAGGVRGLGGRGATALVACALALAGLGLAVAPRFEPQARHRRPTRPSPSAARSRPAARPPPPRCRPCRPPSARRRSPAAPAPRSTLQVAVANHTLRRVTYRLTPLVDGGAWAARTVMLAPGAVWHAGLAGRMPGGDGLHELVITLSEQPGGRAVGDLTLWLQTTGAAR